VALDAVTYVHAQSKVAQDSFMLFQCIFGSLRTEFLKLVTTEALHYHIVDTKAPQEPPIPCGALLLKIIIMKAHVDTRATVSFIRTALSSLDTKMISRTTRQWTQGGKCLYSSFFLTIFGGNHGCPWLEYNSMVKTSKPCLRNAAECSAYALLLFRGNLEVEARSSVIVIDGRVKISANARIGARIRGLLGKMDDPLAQKIKDPTINISDTPEMKLIVNLLFTDGLGG
jgi:hypothetical protein